MSIRTRLIAVGLVCILAIAGAVAYLVHSHAQQQKAIRNAPQVATTDLGQVENEPRIVFRNTARSAKYGTVAMVALSNPAGPRALTDTPCDRVYSAGPTVLCLASDKGIVNTYSASLLNKNLQKERSLPLAGIPSRARLSADGTLAATTSFTAGDSYTSSSFSTRTVITSVSGSGTSSNLEDFTLIQDGKHIKPIDRNFWGVTFGADDNLFYATVAFGGKTWLVKGSISGRTMTTLHADAECPSLSPDGTKVVYKKRSGQKAGTWRLASLDLATGTETMLAETHSVDDQVEWLDSNTVIYGIPRTGTEAAIDDVYAVPADGTGSPRVLIQQAWSPAVVR